MSTPTGAPRLQEVDFVFQRADIVDTETEDRREHIARNLSMMFATWHRLEPFMPYRANANDSYFFTLDRGNDWKVKFYPTDVRKFTLIYRYSIESRYLMGLADWICYRFDCEKGSSS